MNSFQLVFFIVAHYSRSVNKHDLQAVVLQNLEGSSVRIGGWFCFLILPQ
jgi:hypothetical protein